MDLEQQKCELQGDDVFSRYFIDSNYTAIILSQLYGHFKVSNMVNLIVSKILSIYSFAHPYHPVNYSWMKILFYGFTVRCPVNDHYLKGN